MKKMLALTLLFVSASVHAVWIDVSGAVVKITTYAHTETILVELSVDGADVAECSNKKTFAISAGMSEEGRARMYSMLLSAQVTGRVVILSFLDAGGCEPWFSEQNVYRKVARMR